MSEILDREIQTTHCIWKWLRLIIIGFLLLGTFLDFACAKSSESVKSSEFVELVLERFPKDGIYSTSSSKGERYLLLSPSAHFLIRKDQVMINLHHTKALASVAKAFVLFAS